MGERFSMGDLLNTIGEFNPNDYIGKKAYTTYELPRVAAKKEMEKYGLKPPAAFPIGKVFRFQDAQDKSGKQSGWAVYYEYVSDDGIIGICVFGSYHGEPEKITWCNKLPSYMSPVESKEFNERIEHAKAQAEEQRKEEQEKTAAECQKIWDALPGLGETPYTRKKGIKAIGARTRNGVIVLPVIYDGKITSLQYIAEDGSKKFHEGGRIKGGYMLLEGSGKTVYVTEGWATGCSINQIMDCPVYVCFNAGNIYSVCDYISKNVTGKIIIAADDDYNKTPNAGVTYAKKAAEAFDYDIKIPDFGAHPTRGTDFNDLHQLLGESFVKKQLKYVPPKVKRQEEVKQIRDADMPDIPPGAISDIVRFYNATSGNYQPGFALQTALAIVSNICGRYFITDQDNTTTLYFLNVGKSATGKEHCKKIVDRVFYACGLENRIAGDGFTSAAAVISLLLQKPCCITVIDEFGKYMEAAATTKGGMQKEANTALMEAISRPDGIMRPKSYSTMTIPKEQADAMRDRHVHAPSLTLLGLTTPSTFFDQIKLSSVLDGFLNRFLIYVSDAKREPRNPTAMMEVPQSIIDWSKAIQDEIGRLNTLEIAQEIPQRKRIYFSQMALDVQQEFEMKMIDLMNDLEPVRLEALPGRANEWAMRLSLCLALSRDPTTEQITKNDMLWSVDYMGKSIDRLLLEVKDNVSETYIEAGKKEVLLAIRGYNTGITLSQMMKTPPFMKYGKRELEEYLSSLIEAELIETKQDRTGRGRPTIKYRAL